MIPARIPLSYLGAPQRIDSSAPHWARLMMLGGWPGAMTAVGGDHPVSAGACGGVISTALTFCANGCSAVAGRYPSRGLPSVSGRRVGAAGRVIEICADVVLPTKIGSVPRGPPLAASNAVVSTVS